MNKSVLIIDDDEVMRYALNRSLTGMGYQVAEAANLEETQDQLAANAIDWVVLDLRLGHESGLEVARSILAHDPGLIVIIITGYASVSTAVEAIRLGVKDYLIKPVSAEEIVQALKMDRGLEQVPVNTTPMSPKRLEWEHIQRVLLDHNGNITQAAKALKMHRRTLQRKLNKKPVRE
ncbi:response regulator transcription factor [Marinicella sediminis]|uniref:Response regulator transcription factor n=1 Tax=Marinicella sediminis TaxID=1792834 RepID=A0ABV7JBM8_9GAMM|nr:response regulator [Marinicella sediminis]